MRIPGSFGVAVATLTLPVGWLALRDLQIYVDDQPIGMKAIEVKGQAYVPARAVGKMVGIDFQIFKEEGQIMFVSPNKTARPSVEFKDRYSTEKAVTLAKSIKEWAGKSGKMLEQLGDDAASRLSGDQEYMRTLRKSTRENYQRHVKHTETLAGTAEMWGKDPGSMYLTSSMCYWLNSIEAALDKEVKDGMDRMISRQSTAESVKPIQELSAAGVNYHGEVSIYEAKLALWYDQTAVRPR